MTWQELIDMVDIVEYISQYVELQEKGDDLWGNSPFNPNDINPSFSVTPSSQLWYCFSTNQGGNLLNFIMLYEKCNFRTAIEKLKAHFGIKDEIAFVSKPEIIKILKEYRPKFKKERIIDRKILDESYLKQFKKCNILEWQEEGISQEIMDKYGIRLDTNQSRIITPIYDNDGNLINVSGRTVDVNWKDFGLPKYIYYLPLNTVNFLFALNIKREIILAKKEIILVESAKSVMKLDGFGFENSVAVLTSHLNDEQMKILITLGANIVVAFDKDAKPREDKNIERLKRFCKVEIVEDRWNLLGEKDAPMDCGIDAWNKLYEERRSL
ncbi:MAG: CHC2 zinc finger domain-containing protein [bacterium]